MNPLVILLSLLVPTVLVVGVFVGFDVIADSASFRWYAEDGAASAVMGETLARSDNTRLRACSPIPCRFTLVKDGVRVQQTEGRAADWAASGPGQYRVEAELKVLGEWVPWVYANPIRLQ